MSNEKEKTCSWKYCQHPSRVIDTEGVRSTDGKFYHEDCHHKKEKMVEIRKVFAESAPDDLNFAFLSRTIKSLIVDKNNDPDFLLYALQHHIGLRKRIFSPTILHVLAKDSEMQEIYKNRQIALQRAERRTNRKPPALPREEVPTSFAHSKPKQGLGFFIGDA